MYAKIFTQIYDSSIADDWQVRVVFEDFLVLADADGVVDMTPEAIAARTRIPIKIVAYAIEKLEAPDPKSRSPDHDGRRIIRLDDHRNWGWIIVNYQTYRKIHCESDRRETVQVGRFSKTRKGYVYYLLNGSKDRVKIGFSKNPWARADELKTADPGATVVATEKALFSLEHDRHSKFSHLRIDREWFHFTQELKEFIGKIEGNSVVSVVHVVTTPPSSYPSSSALQKGGMGENQVELPVGFPVRVEDAITHAAFIACDADFASKVWNTAMGRGGRDAKEVPIQSWRHYLATQWAYEQERRAKGTQTNGRVYPRDLDLQIKAIQKQIDEHPANPQSVCCTKRPTDLEKEALRQLRVKQRELNNRLAAGV